MAANSSGHERRTRPVVSLVGKMILICAVSVVLLLGGLAGCWDSSALERPGRPPMRAVPGEYVVTFGDGIAGVPLPSPAAGPSVAGDQSREVPDRLQVARIRAAVADSVAAEAAAIAAGGIIEFRYRTAVIGFSGKLPPAALAAISRVVENQPHIEPNWEADQRLERNRSMAAADVAEAPPVPRGLDRIDQRLLPLNESFERPMGGSEEVHVYVIDSGIRETHAEFSRAGGGSSRVGDGFDSFPTPAEEDDCLEHGTHVAGTIGGKTFGVTAEVELHPVRVISCAGKVKLSRAVAGINWVLEDYLERGKPAVANMSLGFDAEVLTEEQMPKLFAMEEAIENSILLGIPYVVAAGNDMLDACDISPARVTTAITVASVDPQNDTQAESSNFGDCVDLFAPGVEIASASASDDEAWGVHDGTSHAAPHVTGVAALFLSSSVGADADDVWNGIRYAANVEDTPDWCGVLERGSDTANILLHWGAGSPDGTNDMETETETETETEPAPDCAT